MSETVWHPPLPAETRGRRIRLGIALLVSCVALIAWIVDLSLSLPMHYLTRGWRLAWTGYDVGELMALAVTAYSALRDRWMLIPSCVVTATLLLCDAWFDVALSTGTNDFLISIATALLVEVPTATVLGLVAWRLTRRSALDHSAGPVAARRSARQVQVAAVRDAVLRDDVRAILDGQCVATLATIGPDGQPRTRVIGLRRDGDSLLLTITAPRWPARHLAAAAQVSVSVVDLTDPRSAVEIRGTAHLLGDDDLIRLAAGGPAAGEHAGPSAAGGGARETVPAAERAAAVAALPDPVGVRLVARLVPTAITRLAA
jgi:hypothetical protein